MKTLFTHVDSKQVHSPARWFTYERERESERTPVGQHSSWKIESRRVAQVVPWLQKLKNEINKQQCVFLCLFWWENTAGGKKKKKKKKEEKKRRWCTILKPCVTEWKRFKDEINDCRTDCVHQTIIDGILTQLCDFPLIRSKVCLKMSLSTHLT